MKDTPITFTLPRDKEIELMRCCVSEGMTLCEKLNSLVDDFLHGKVKLTQLRTKTHST